MCAGAAAFKIHLNLHTFSCINLIAFQHYFDFSFYRRIEHTLADFHTFDRIVHVCVGVDWYCANTYKTDIIISGHVVARIHIYLNNILSSDVTCDEYLSIELCLLIV